jgi:hypothetical protein
VRKILDTTTGVPKAEYIREGIDLLLQKYGEELEG